jgi:(p)ppGpp synthase/HD superfamily hydrolase
LRDTVAVDASDLCLQVALAMTTGYSDRINHALAFAAKHHDRQVRKGTRMPYLTQPANVAIILTRYGQDDGTVVAGILHDVIEDCVREAYTREMLEQRIGDKFGVEVLDTVLAVTHRRVDDDGIELSSDERRDDYLERLASSSDAARWVCAADKLHSTSTILADLRRTIDPDTVWNRLNGGRDATVRWYRRVYERLAALGFRGEIMQELGKTVVELEEYEPAPDVIHRDATGSPW